MCAADGSTIVARRRRGRARGRSRSTSRRTGRDVAFMHSDEPDAQRTDGVAARRAGRLRRRRRPDRRARAGSRSRGRDRRRRRRRGAAGGTLAHLARARRAATSAPRAPGAPWSVVLARADRRGAGARRARTRRRAAARRRGAAVGRASLVVDRREEPPGAGLLTEALADRAARRRRPGGVRAQPAGPVPRARVRRRASTLLRWDRPAERPLVCAECGATRAARAARRRHARPRGAGGARSRALRVLDVDAATAEVGDADILIGTEAVLHRPECAGAAPALVAFLDLDQELLAPRYRAAAQAHWLTTRGAQLLAGRPRDETLPARADPPARSRGRARARDRASPSLVADAEIEYRRTLGFPPFGALAELAATTPRCSRPSTRCAGSTSRRRRCRCSVRPTGARSSSRPTADALADALALAALPAGRADRPRPRRRRSAAGLSARDRGAARGFTTMPRWRLTPSGVFGDPVLKRPTAPRSPTSTAALVEARRRDVRDDVRGATASGWPRRRSACSSASSSTTSTTRPARTCSLNPRDRRDVGRVDLRRGLPLAARASRSRSCARSSSPCRASTSTATRS